MGIGIGFGIGIGTGATSTQSDAPSRASVLRTVRYGGRDHSITAPHRTATFGVDIPVRTILAQFSIPFVQYPPSNFSNSSNSHFLYYHITISQFQPLVVRVVRLVCGIASLSLELWYNPSQGFTQDSALEKSMEPDSLLGNRLSWSLPWNLPWNTVRIGSATSWMRARSTQQRFRESVCFGLKPPRPGSVGDCN